MPSLLLKGLLVEIRGTAIEQLWHSSNLPFNRQARGSENRTGVSFFFCCFFKKRKYESKFSASLFVWRYKENGRRGGSTGTKKKIHKRETNSAHTNTHAHTHMQEKKKKKKQGTSLTYECHMQMVGREQMLLHLIDLYVNCIQTFQCVFWAHCVQFLLAF